MVLACLSMKYIKGIDVARTVAVTSNQKKYINLKKKNNVDTMASRLIKCIRNEKVLIKKVFKTKKC